LQFATCIRQDFLSVKKKLIHLFIHDLSSSLAAAAATTVRSTSTRTVCQCISVLWCSSIWICPTTWKRNNRLSDIAGTCFDALITTVWAPIYGRVM